MIFIRYLNKFRRKNRAVKPKNIGFRFDSNYIIGDDLLLIAFKDIKIRQKNKKKRHNRNKIKLRDSLLSCIYLVVICASLLLLVLLLSILGNIVYYSDLTNIMTLYWLILILNINIYILICICMCIYMYICKYSINILLINLFLLGWFIILPSAIFGLWIYNFEYVLSKPPLLQCLFILGSFLSFGYHIIMWKKIWNLDMIQDDYIKLHLHSLIPTFLDAITTIIGIGITMYLRGVNAPECNILPIFLGTLILSPYFALLSSNLLNWYKPEVHRVNPKI